jgi:hypothetical protein
MAAHNGYLCIGIFTQIETIQIWEYDGTTWTHVSTAGFGGTENWPSSPLVIYRGSFYVGTSRYEGTEIWEHTEEHTTGTQIWEYDGTTWIQVNIDGFGDLNNHSSYSMVIYNERLYVGTGNVKTGTEIWEYDGETWIQVNIDGFGDMIVN